MQESFKKYPTSLFKATEITSNKGKLVVDHNIKAVYLYMLLRSDFFKQTEDVFYENQDQIALNCGLSRRTVIRIIQKLQEFGILEVNKVRLRSGALSNNYVVHHVDGNSWWYGSQKQSEVAEEILPF